MSNYTITTDFGAKDSLPSSNDSKVVRGSEFTTEFTSIQTAIATKADTAGDTFTGVVNFSADVAVNTNTLFVDVSEAKVGIGTNSPQALLHVQDSLGSPQIRIDNQGTGSGIASLMFHGGGTGNPTSIIQSGGADSGNVGIIFKHGNNGSETERMRIDTSGNVSIGLTSKSSATTLKVENAAGYAPTLEFNQSGTGAASIAVPANENALQFNRFNGSSLEEAMRIDASGNVLVGTTSVSNSGKVTIDAGDNASGLYAVTDATAGYAASVFERSASDGDITVFKKDGSTVGSIGTVSGDIRIGGSDNNHAGIRFAASTKAVIPVKNTDGDLSDNTTDLGASSARFKDLYLSGTGYSDSLLVGTTGATANAKLKVNGAVILNANTIYSKSYSTLNTTGDIVAKATGSSNGSSTTFIFTGQGGSGAPFHIVFSCINAGGQWSATRSEIAASASVDVVASTSGNDVLFTFKSKSGSQGYSPRVRIETIGNSYDSTYLA